MWQLTSSLLYNYFFETYFMVYSKLTESEAKWKGEEGKRRGGGAQVTFNPRLPNEIVNLPQMVSPHSPFPAV